MLFLQILGAVFIIVLLVAAWYGWKVFRFFRKVKSGALYGEGYGLALSVLPALDLELERSDTDAWQVQEKLFEQENLLRKLGFSHQHYLECYPGQATVQVSLWNYKQQMVFVLYEATPDADDNNSQFIMEAAVKFQEGGSLCVSNSPDINNLPRPKNHPIINLQSNDPREILKKLKASIPKSHKISKIVDSEAFFREAYEQTTEYVWREENLRSEKVLGMLRQVGFQDTEENMTALIEHGNSERSYMRTNQLLKRISENPGITAAQWESMRDRLVIIHQDMTPETFVAAVEELCAHLSEAQEEILEQLMEFKGEFQPFKELEKLKKPLASVMKAKKVASMRKPVQAIAFLPQ